MRSGTLLSGSYWNFFNFFFWISIHGSTNGVTLALKFSLRHDSNTLIIEMQFAISFTGQSMTDLYIYLIL